MSLFLEEKGMDKSKQILLSHQGSNIIDLTDKKEE